MTMNRLRKHFAPLMWAHLGAIFLAMAACSVPVPRVIVAAPFKGKVIDAETKKPLVGAVVLVDWNLEAPGIAHGPIERFLAAEETLTGDEGEFVIGKWSPQATIPGTWVGDPHFVIYSPGYGPYPMHGVPPVKKRGYAAFLKALQTDGVTFELPPLKTRKERLREEFLGTSLALVPPRETPHLRRLLNVSRLQLGLSPDPEDE